MEVVKTELPIRVRFWRSVGNTRNALVKETFLDALARTANSDPLEFRLNHLKDPSARRVLQVAVANAVFSAAGARLRRLPMAPQAVMEAMKKG